MSGNEIKPPALFIARCYQVIQVYRQLVLTPFAYIVVVVVVSCSLE